MGLFWLGVSFRRVVSTWPETNGADTDMAPGPMNGFQKTGDVALHRH